MSIYAKTIKSVTEVRTVNAHLAALGKLMATTEDWQLSHLIKTAALSLQFQIAHSIGKPMPTSLMFFPTPAMVDLVQYCRYQTQSKKEEWQVLAERNGWEPPNRRKASADIL